MEPEDSIQENVDLVRRVAAGDKEAEERLCQKYRERVLVLVRIKTGYHKAAEDICQEILIALLEAARKGNIKEPQKLSSFVNGIFSHKVHDWFEERQTQKAEVNPDKVEPELLDPEQGALDQIITDEEQAKIDQVLDNLKERERKILQLRYFYEWSHEEISKKLNLQPEAVRQAAARAIKKIRRKLAKDW